MAVLDTSWGFVFECREGDLLVAEYDPSRYSTTGPIWRVFELDRRYVEENMAPSLYDDYATEAGRDWRRRNR